MNSKISKILAYVIILNIMLLLTACSSAGSETSIINKTPITIETETIGNGSIEFNPARENNSYERGEKVEIKAKAEELDSEFVEWRGSVAGDENPHTITVEEEMKIIARFSGHLAGEGTEDEPYQIANFKDLEMLSNDEDDYYKLTDDIDASPTRDDEYHQGWNPIGDKDNPFQASLDGQGHKIKNLKIDRLGDSKIGLFTKIGKKGIVKNLGITEAEIQGGRKTGGLAGVNKGLVKRSYVEADIKAAANKVTVNNVGGLIGQNDAGRVEESFTSGSVSGDGFVGGLVGLNDYQTEISNSYSLSDIEALEDGPLGGLIGVNRGEVEKSYAAGEIDDTYTDKVGGLVWSNSTTDGSINDSYFDKEVTGQELLIGNDRDSQKGQTTKEMKSKDIFASWDFTTNGIWSIDSEVNAGYPYLQYQIK